MIDKGLFKACLSANVESLSEVTLLSAKDLSLYLGWTSSLAIIEVYEHITSHFDLSHVYLSSIWEL